ncbi:hypothetical protein dsx2_0498 [Desulfovibrio sp. X2]|uniref:hypothetical protein n=1 Tax=Desulfovibrio sp. X2 TaxID=941449 RepID=UPI0003587AEC|nr:hypothetical protein [Desulfovibrio sp. X2]EPR38689.1 hypothetical protein dsx2_0498 [Desulfovibrio sp. X2]
MDAIIMLISLGTAGALLIALRLTRRGKGRSDAVQRINFDLYKERELGNRGLAGKI